MVETAVLNELLARGFKVYVGKTRKGEFDAIRVVDNAYPKYVISMDSITNSVDGIQHFEPIDFLKDESLLRLGRGDGE